MPSLHDGRTNRGFFIGVPSSAKCFRQVDTGEADEVIVAVAKTVAELTSRQDGAIRQHLIEHLMREIMKYDDEFRQEDAADAVGSHSRH